MATWVGAVTETWAVELGARGVEEAPELEVGMTGTLDVGALPPPLPPEEPPE